MGDLVVTEQGQEVRPKHAGGRPTLYSDAVAQRICDYLAEGTSLRATCGLVGIETDTYYAWREEHSEFLVQSNRARAQGEYMYSNCMRKAAQGDPEFKGDYRAAESVLKRQFVASGWGDVLDIRKVDPAQLLELMRAGAESNVVPTVVSIEAGDEDI